MNLTKKDLENILAFMRAATVTMNGVQRMIINDLEGKIAAEIAAFDSEPTEALPN
jgi:hypothetical protein